MECKNCNIEMELEEYYIDFLNNDEEICLREEFWCARCGATAIKRTYYKKESEEVKYGN